MLNIISATALAYPALTIGLIGALTSLVVGLMQYFARHRKDRASITRVDTHGLIVDGLTLTMFIAMSYYFAMSIHLQFETSDKLVALMLTTSLALVIAAIYFRYFLTRYVRSINHVCPAEEGVTA